MNENNLDFTFLTDEQIFGNVQLDIIKKYGTKCAITDFSILLGGVVSNYYYTNEGNSRNDRTGWWWTKTPYNNDALDVSKDGLSNGSPVNSRNVGARPSLLYSSISSISSNGVRGRNGILEVEYGEYPQTVVSEDFSRILEKAFENMPDSNNEMKATGKSYTTDSVRFQDKNTPFQARTHTEYEYNGKKYIRFVGDTKCIREVLSDGRRIQNGDVYWVEVEPIKWMIDERTNIALSKKIIFSGVQFRRNYKGDFNRTDIKEFMDRYFSKEIIPYISKSELLKLEEIKVLDEWLEWSKENMIHPIIHMFMISTNGKYLNKEINWKEVSNILYETRDLLSLQELFDSTMFKDLNDIFSNSQNIVNSILNNNTSMEEINSINNMDKYKLVTYMTLYFDDELINLVVNKMGNKYIKYYKIILEQYKVENEYKHK